MFVGVAFWGCLNFGIGVLHLLIAFVLEGFWGCLGVSFASGFFGFWDGFVFDLCLVNFIIIVVGCRLWCFHFCGCLFITVRF